ncbi:MAG: PKD domain-containing protein [Thermoplasmata archaeon]
MTSRAMSKLSACFLVLMMALAALVVLPGANEGQAPGTNDIYVPVVESKYSLPVPEATVTLTNVHTGEVLTAQYSSGPYFVVHSAPSGYFRVDVTADNYYDSRGEVHIRFNGLTSNSTSPITLGAFPTKEWTWNVTVSPVIQNALVGFYNPVKREIVAQGKTNADGWVAVDMFDTSSLGTYYLIVQASGFQTYYESVVVDSDNPAKSVTLTAAKQVTGFVNTASGLAQNVVAYLLDTDPSVPWIARLLKSEKQTGFFRFDAVVGHSYILCVDADAASANITTVTVTPTTPAMSIALAAQTQRTDNMNIAYGPDYTSFVLSLSTTWSFDDAFPGLNYSDIGSLRMQIDLNGNADGIVDADEATDFQLMMMAYGAQDVTSARLLVVNKTTSSLRGIYVANDALTTFDLGSTEGSVTLKTGIAYSYSCGYTVYTPPGEDPLPVTSPIYAMSFTAKYDSPATNRVYTINLMPDYELVQNSSADSKVFVGGYLTVTIDPDNGSGSIELGLTVEKSMKASAGAALNSSPSSYAVMEDKNVSMYIVRVGANVTFNGSSSDDPNGNPLTYVWDFGDGSGPVTTLNETIVYNYTAAAELLTVNLTVRDVTGNPALDNWTTIKVRCDALEPAPVITVKNRTITNSSISLNQRETVTFNATSSTDDAVTAGDGLGMIGYVEFDYGDGNSSGRISWDEDQQNVTHSYERAGTFTLVLNVTDVVGHWKNITMAVKVNDTTAPVASFTVKNADKNWSTTLIENNTLVFDANATRDNLNNNTQLNYSWYFGDGTWLNKTGADRGWNVTHQFHRIGPVTVTLNVSDVAGNYHKYPKTITIASSPRPDMRITGVTYEPAIFTEGKSGFIVVNMTNMGAANATNIVVTFYIVKPDGTQEQIGLPWTQILNGTDRVDTVLVGGKVQVRFPWTFDNKGTYKIKVNVTAANQLKENTFTVSSAHALEVKEASWKKAALWGGVIAVIVLVPLLLYLRGRWSRRERKGPRREKKEKGEEEEL